MKSTPNGTVNLLYRNCPKTVWLVKDAVIKARPARELWADHHTILRTSRAEPGRARGAENGNYRNIEQVREVHWTTIVADKKPAAGEQS